MQKTQEELQKMLQSLEKEKELIESELSKYAKKDRKNLGGQDAAYEELGDEIDDAVEEFQAYEVATTIVGDLEHRLEAVQKQIQEIKQQLQ